jgi:hypothetical protein
LETNGAAQTQVPKREPWQDEILQHALDFANRVANDFRVSIESSLRFLPNKADASLRAKLLNEFFNVMPDVVARIVCDFGSPKEEIEKAVHAIVARRFAESRDALNKKNIATLKNNGIITPQGVVAPN